MANGRYAVLIADVVSSTALAPAYLRAILTRKLRAISDVQMADGRIRLPYEVTAGDETQTLASDLEQVPTLIFELRRRFRPLALRIGIGIGEIPGRIVAPVNRLTGEAFVFARQALNGVRNAATHRFPVLTGFCSTDTRFDQIASALYGLHDTLVQNISDKQWETINAYLEKRRVDAAARALHVNISTVSRNLKRGYLWQMQETANIMKSVIKWRFS